MKDPDSGLVPSENGALARSGQDGKPSSRRGRRRRKKGANPSAPAVAASQTGPTGEAERPKSAPPEGKSRKRKRRRKSRGPTPIDGFASLDPAAIAAAVTKVVPPENQHKRKPRNRRGPQGRPLQTSPQVKTSQKQMPTGAVADPALEPQPVVNHPVAERFQVNGRTHQRHQSDNFYAALDLGTNNCRLLIAQPTRPGQFRVVDAFSRIVRLGEGLAASGRLSQEAMDRAVEALKVCAAKLKNREIRRMRLIATEACRAASNGEAFLSRVVEETGLHLEIINRETEARLAVSGCSSLIGQDASSAVLFDIGGGSSEIAVLQIGEQRSARLANHITHWTSLPVGVVTLSERHGGRDVTPDVFAAMTDEVGAMLDAFDSPPLAALDKHGRHSDGSSRFHLIGTSGTVTTLAGVYLNLPRYDRRQVDGLWLSDDAVNDMQAKLLSLGFDQRAANPCIGPDRADLVLAGCAILEAIRRRWPSERMRVADRGLREGLLTDMMADDGVWSRHGMRRPSFYAGKRN